MLPFYYNFKNLCQKRVTGLGLSVFRTFFTIILIVEVAKLFYFRHLYFDPVPYIVEAELSVSLVLLGWLAVLFFLLIGLFTRTAAIINYVLVLVFFSSFTTIKYHFDAALVGLSFLLVILPVSNNLSIDSLIYELQSSQAEERKVRRVYYFLPVLLVLCLQYTDSFFHKAASDVWLKGLGVWLPASLPNQIYNDHVWLLNQREFMISLGYLVMMFEFAFIFLVLFRKLRPWLILIGVIMHLSIAITFPIPSFGITFAGVYMLFLPAAFWSKLSDKIHYSRGQAFAHLSWSKILFVVMPARAQVRKESDQKSFVERERLKVKLIYFFALYMILAQFIRMLNAPLVIKLSEGTGMVKIRQYTQMAFSPLEVINAKLLGITENLIYTGFEEGHYNILALECIGPGNKTVWLPITDEQGKASAYSFGRMFTKWSRTIGAYPEDLAQVKEGVVKFSSFWAAKNNISLQNATFRVLAKKTTVKFEWEKNYLEKQMNRPWREIGRLKWQNNQPLLLLQHHVAPEQL